MGKSRGKRIRIHNGRLFLSGKRFHELHPRASHFCIPVMKLVPPKPGSCFPEESGGNCPRLQITETHQPARRVCPARQDSRHFKSPAVRRLQRFLQEQEASAFGDTGQPPSKEIGQLLPDRTFLQPFRKQLRISAPKDDPVRIFRQGGIPQW